MAGRKLIYLYGFVVFTIGSALCGLAPTLLALDGARVIQAVGAAMLQANSVAIIVLAVPPRSIGKAVGFQGQPRPSASRWGRRSAVCWWRRAGGG